MHPKAVLCMLAGFRPYIYRSGIPETGFRIARQAVQDAPALYLRGRSTAVGKLTSAKVYTTAEWDAIPDALWDTVTDDLIAKLFNLFGENDGNEKD